LSALSPPAPTSIDEGGKMKASKKSIPVLVVLAVSFMWSQGSQRQILDVRTLMTASEFHNAGLDKLNENEITNLNIWLSSFSLQLMTRQSLAGAAESFENLEGAAIIADDGQYLGKITTNSIDRRSSIPSADTAARSAQPPYSIQSAATEVKSHGCLRSTQSLPRRLGFTRAIALWAT